MFSKLEKIMLPLAEKIGRNKYLIAIRNGFLVSTPLLIAGSFFLLLANFPIPQWINFLETTVINSKTGTTLAEMITKPADATFTIMAVFAVVGIGYSFAKEIKANPIFGAAVTLMSWFLLMPYSVTGEVTVEGMANPVSATLTALPLSWVGAKGIFIGIICAFVSVNLYQFAVNRKWVIKMPEGVPPMVEDSFAALIPGAFVMLIFFALNLVLNIFGTNAFDLVFNFLQIPLLHLGDTVWAMIIAYIFLHVFWFFGVNGSSVVGAVFNPILLTHSLENVEYFKNGTGAPHIVNAQFQDLFATFGGAGSTLSLLIAMLIVCRSKRIKELGKLALVPGIFGINEPIIFGLPIVLNPLIFIPFVLVPTFNIIVSYIMMNLHLVPITNGVLIPWTTPIIISGFLATNWAGALLQLVLLIIGVFIYIPFIKIMDVQYMNEERQAADAELEAITEEMLSFDNL